MARIFFLSLLFLFGIDAVSAQDLLILTNGDSIRVNLKSESSYRYEYEVIVKGKPKRLSVPAHKVKKVLIGSPIIPVYSRHSKYTDPLGSKRYSARAGYGYSVAAAPPGPPGHWNQLRNGGHFGFDFAHYFKDWLGLGVFYEMNLASASSYGFVFNRLTGFYGYGEISDFKMGNLIGPLLSFRVGSSKSTRRFNIDVCFGYYNLFDDGVVGDPMTLTAHSFSSRESIGMDFPISGALRLGLEFSFAFAPIFSYTMSSDNRSWEFSSNSSYAMNESRLQASAVLRMVK